MVKEIKEVIEIPVNHPKLFEELGIAQPKGVLLYGPSVTGKMLLTRRLLITLTVNLSDFLGW